MEEIPKIFIVIPAYNEAPVIASLINKIKSLGYHNIIVVDDGSRDNTFSAATNSGALCLSHRINRGKGAATKTGIEAGKILGAGIIATMDGDGQHDPQDISKLVAPILNGECDVTLGTRMIKLKQMPPAKVMANQVANALTWVLYGKWVKDSQSGFRAYSKRALSFINTTGDKYEYESEVIKEISTYNLVYKEIPIKVLYTDYSSNKGHGQSLTNGLKTLYKLFWDKISF